MSTTSQNSGHFKYECPFCLTGLVPPVFQCFNGHLLCDKCIEKVKVCPVCRDELPTKKIKALAIENILRESLIPCPFSDMGCKVLSHEDREVEDHKYCCSYASLNYCLLIGLQCGQSVRKEHLLDHFNSNHEAAYFSNYVYGEDLQISGDNLVAAGKDHGQGDRKVFLIHSQDQLFALECIENKNEDLISWKVLLIGTEKTASEFCVSIKIIPVTSEAGNKSVSLEWNGPASSCMQSMEMTAITQDRFAILYSHFPTLFSFWGANRSFEVIVKWRIILKIEKTAGDAAVVVHSAFCDACGDKKKIIGTRYKCLKCPNYDLCDRCMKKKRHAHHVFAIIPQPHLRRQLPYKLAYAAD